MNEETKARKKRSVEPYNYYALHKPSRFLEQHNVGYRIKVPANYPSKTHDYKMMMTITSTTLIVDVVK